MRRLLLFGLLHLLSTHVFAGWYDCYTYDGKIAGMNVKVYLQLMEIHARSGDTIPVSGVYKYESTNQPIVLRGKLINNDVLELTEFHDKIAFAKLTIQWGGKNLKGQWTSDKRTYNIALTQIGRIVDTKNDVSSGPTEVLMTSSFKDQYIVGLYQKGKDEYRARITEIKVIDKKTNVVKNVIRFDVGDDPVGNVTTNIFDNLTAWEPTANWERSIEVTVDDGRGGQSFFMRFNPKTDTYSKEGL